MSGKQLKVVLGLVVAGALIAAYRVRAHTRDLWLTGIVTTNEVLVSPMIGGQVSRLLVAEGDSVRRGDLLALIAPDELTADRAYYEHTAEGFAGLADESAATLRLDQQQTVQQIQQAEATLAAAVAQQSEAAASLENARRQRDRQAALAKQGYVSSQDADAAETAYSVAQARADATAKQVEAQRAALAVARAAGEQVLARRSALRAAQQQRAAATAQATKASVRLGYTELRAPVNGLVDTRAVRVGEIVAAGQPVVTVIDQDDLWVRADVEETYAGRIRPGDSLLVRLPSGREAMGRVFYRGADADFATQRDVSRSKRDIKAFEIRLRVDNRERLLAVGMTASVRLPASVRRP